MDFKTQGPKHVAFILDGNRRWAQKNKLSSLEGHRRGADRAFEIAQAAFARGIEYVTLYVFSVENWKRAPLEVQGLMGLLEQFLTREGKKILNNNITLKTLGDPSAFPAPIRNALNTLSKGCRPHEETRNTLLLALNYGARTELIQAVQAYTQDALEGRVSTPALDWEAFSRYLYTKAIPDPDLIIRTAGEQRLSNFLLLQSAYAELYFTPIYWPDFTAQDFDAALMAFAQRKRLFGAGSR